MCYNHIQLMTCGNLIDNKYLLVTSISIVMTSKIMRDISKLFCMFFRLCKRFAIATTIRFQHPKQRFRFFYLCFENSIEIGGNSQYEIPVSL